MIRVAFRHRRRKGASLLLFASLLVMLLGFVALAVDTGYMFHVRCDLQRSVDAAARAGAGAMIEGTGKGRQEAIKYLESNPVGDYTLHESDADIEFGVWNEVTRSFTPTHSGPNAIKVTASSNSQPLFFASVWDKYTFSTQASAICISQPRDIVLVLDYSGSMAYDSQFRNLGLLGQSQIEASMQKMYGDFNSPHYGSLTFAPVAYETSSTSTADVIAHFGLTNVPYPYPGGSWSEYVRYVQTDSYINAAGYRNKYAYADTVLMKQVADITGGVTFVIPGGQTVEMVKAQLEEVFRQVAAVRPLKLVQ